MKIVVFGATGATGKHIVHKLVAEGHTVTAFARTPANVDAPDGAVRIVQGDARDAAKVLAAVTGQDVVMAAFGPRSTKKDDIQTVFMQNVLAAMDQANVQRLIELSAWGAGADLPNGQFMFKIIRHTILKNVFDDKNAAEALIVSSGVDYTLVRPGRLTNGHAKGNVKAVLDGKGVGRAIAREDVAAFMVAQINNKAWSRKSPIIGY